MAKNRYKIGKPYGSLTGPAEYMGVRWDLYDEFRNDKGNFISIQLVPKQFFLLATKSLRRLHHENFEL